MLHCAPLNPIRFPLVERFYQLNYKVSKPKKDEAIWTLEQNNNIIGAVRFCQLKQSQLLTGLAIDSQYRRQGLGLSLLQGVIPQMKQKTCYCFAYKYLQEFYQQAGFRLVEVNHLPEGLKARFERYCSSGKNLISMQWANN